MVKRPRTFEEYWLDVRRRCEERRHFAEEYEHFRFGRRVQRDSKEHKRDGEKPARARFGIGRIK